MLKFALDAVGVFALGSRLGSLQDSGDGKRLMELNEEITRLLQVTIFCRPSLLPFLPQFRRLEKLSGQIYKLSKHHVEAALDRLQDSDQTLLAKLARKLGRDSPIIVTMGADSLAAGLDTTGAAAAFLLYHLASNPDKQERLYQELCNTVGA